MKYISKILLLVTMILTIISTSVLAYNDTEHWAKNYIDYVTEKGYFYGVSDTEFNPEGNMTRGMFCTVLARYENVDLSKYKMHPFSDIAKESYYTRAAIWAYNRSIVVGTSTTTFEPDSPITREQVATILYRYLSPEVQDKTCTFSDVDEISDYALEAVTQLQGVLFTGTPDNTFDPKGLLTRSQAAVLFSKLDNKVFDIYTPAPKEVLTYIGTYKLSYYCSGCSGTITASGNRATPDKTVALPRSMWSKWSQYKGKTIYIENIGYRVIEDKCGTDKFDLYCGGGCNYQPYNQTYQKIYLVE